MKEKKDKDKKRKRSEDQGDENSSVEESKEKRRARREERKQWLEKVPKVDDHGIAYTKLQLRRMAKRVARGLDPIESEAEKQERLKSEAELRRQEQDELEGIVRKSNPGDEKDSDSEAEDSDTEKEQPIKVFKKEASNSKLEVEPNTVYKNKRKKLVPDDYICSACQNKHTPLHWIYDCPNKKTIRGTNQLSKRLRGLHNPAATKVFVSGLPFSMTSKDLKEMFEKACGPVTRAKAITFPDSGRCKGQGIVTFQEEEGSRKALTIMNGKRLDMSGDKKTGEKQLQLKVTKVLNRKVSKQAVSS